MQTRGLNDNHNHTLESVFKGAATTVATQRPTSALGGAYKHRLDSGTKPNLAKVTLARKIASTVLSMWKHKEAYDAAKHAAKPPS